jgi:alginate O-acetyltransferase complex protein AlgI
VYIPLGGNRAGKTRQAINTLATFTVSGLWHGANWTFVAWGFLNGLLCIPKILFGQPLVGLTRSPNMIVRGVSTACCILITFLLILVTWIFFRAQSIAAAGQYLRALWSPSLLDSPVSTLRHWEIGSAALYAGLAVAVMVILEWTQRDKRFALELDGKVAARRWATTPA